MSRLEPAKLHVQFGKEITVKSPINGRHYTLTHSDTTGELYLTIDKQYAINQISGWYTRLMRDEVLAVWRIEHSDPVLNVYCHVSGGLVIGSAKWRDAIFKHELPLVLEAFRYGDRKLFAAHPELDDTAIKVHFKSHRRHVQRTEQWGTPADYKLFAQST